jgi:hypothetical protein
LTHICKLSHSEWKAFGLDISKQNTWNWSTFCHIGLNLFKPSQRFVRNYNTILFTIVRVFWLGFIQDKITITFWPITANYRTENGKPLAWIFSRQMLEIEAPFAVFAWIYSSQVSDLFGYLSRYWLLLFVCFELDLFRTRLP